MPTLGASAVVIHESKVLLMQRRDVEVWSIPGGAVEANESVAQAAIREVLEETGIHIELTRLVGIYTRPQWGAEGDHAVVFAGKPLTHTITIQPEEVRDAGYFPPEDLPQPFAWWIKERIHDAMNGVVGTARVQDAIWPSYLGAGWRKKMEESPLTPNEFYAKHFTQVGPQGESVEVSGSPHG